MQAQRKDGEIITKLFTFLFYALCFCLFFLPNIIIYRLFILILKTFSMLHSTPIPSYIYFTCYIFSFIPTYFIDTFPEGYQNFLKLYTPILNTVRITILTFILPSIFLYTFSFASTFPYIINILIFYGTGCTIFYYGVRYSNEFQLNVRSMKCAQLDKARIRIVHLHDVNLNLIRNSYFMEQLIYKINIQQPDIIVITGDLIKDDNSFGEDCLSLLSKLKVPIVYNGKHKLNKILNNFHCINEDGYVEVNELIFMKTKSEKTFGDDLNALKLKLQKKKTQMKILLHDNYEVCSKYKLKEYDVSLVLTGFEERHKNVFYIIYDYFNHSAMSEFYEDGEVYYFVNYGMNLLYHVMRFHHNHIGVIDVEGKNRNKVVVPTAANTKKVSWFKKIFGSKN